MPKLLLTGQTDEHLCSPADAELLGARVNCDVVQPFLQLKDEAREAGFDLRILSGFRGFEEQLSIWSRKATGKRAVLDSDAVPLDIAALSDKELVFAILRWSALPGASRHHWGTDLDVDERIATGKALGFFRPYDRDRRGVAPERWHLSHAPVSVGYLQRLTTDILRATIQQADIELKDVVLEHLDEIYERFVININRPSA